MFTKIIAALISVVMAILSFPRTFPEVTPTDVPVKENFNTELRFMVFSDSHVKKFGDYGCQRIMKMLKTGYNLAEKDENHPTLDAAVMAGDITDRGLPTAFADVKMSIEHCVKEETDILGLVAKAHDSYGGRISRYYVSNITGDPADFHKVINGFHFIGISAGPTSAVHYTDAQIEWLDAELAKAVADDPSKPVFVFQHEHVLDTVYGSYQEDTWGVDYFTEILKKYPQVIHMSGHSHYPANDPRTIWQDEFTAINDGSFAYYEFTIDGAKSQHPESWDSMAQCLLVEVDDQNRVLVRVCDLTADKVMDEFLIDNVTEAKKTKYNQDVRRAAATAPVLNGDLSVEQNDGKVTIKSAPATPGNDDVVFIYRLEIKGTDNNRAVSMKKLGDYYKTLTPADVEFTTDQLEKGSYVATLTAEGAWGLKSEPLCAEFTVK